MDPSSPVADLTAFFIQEIGSLLFGLVFLFLWRQSRVVYFGLWAAAWGLRAVATVFGFELLRHGGTGWLAPYATFDFAFAIVLIAAARAGFGTGLRDWRTVLRLIAIPADVRGAGLRRRPGLRAWRPTMSSHALGARLRLPVPLPAAPASRRARVSHVPLLAAGAGGSLLRARLHLRVPVQPG